jgi:UTP--glucose-1-phosphate uridylyltransferase
MSSTRFGEEPVLVLWPDDVFVAEVPGAQQLIRAYEQTGCPVLALLPMDPADSRRYGVPLVKEDLGEGQLRITGLVEKPDPEDAPSAYAAIGGYVITPAIVEELREQTRRWYEATRKGEPVGEVYLTDAINAYAAHRAVYGQVIQGTWYDTGNPSDYLVAQMAHALNHPDYGPVLRDLVRERSGRHRVWPPQRHLSRACFLGRPDSSAAAHSPTSSVSLKICSATVGAVGYRVQCPGR